MNAPSSDSIVAVPTPEQALASVGIRSRGPVALAHALEWVAVLARIYEGQSERDACYLARVPYHRWQEWIRLGSTGRRHRWGCDAHGRSTPSPDCAACARRRTTPVAPFNELVVAARWYRAHWRAGIHRNMVARAQNGDQRAAEYALARADNQELLTLRAENARLQLQLLRERIRLVRAQADALQRKADGTADEREVIDLTDPRWAALQREVFGHARQGLADVPENLQLPAAAVDQALPLGAVRAA